MKAIEINGEIKTYGKIPSEWNGVLNYNSASNIEQQELDGWKQVELPQYDGRTHRLGEYYDNGTVVTKDAIQLSNEQIAQNVANELGSYLDEVYPLWERIKHTAYGSECMLAMIQQQPYDADKLSMVQELLDWVTRCRNSAEDMVTELYTNGTIPSFEFEQRPVL